ncbi:acyl-CoA dehydrogenase family protein [Myxococcus sp. K15C18031901]|uniref:acyl-CoA dehydrogenase family protein n=1 Tax=Myxococcus dinghuensis TaxID=2906761 RepID=UPI0020A7D608|nr:acyl-CoA dehydrogenase family protein [Myxococcus dinghuensis]MCP3102819.1 acyl-CoA dehydrogenase family protein [Myxococcus dinghuensis]
MDFGWTSEQATLYERACAFARAELNGATEQGAGLPRAAWRRCGEFGFLGLPVPERYGGLGVDTLTTARLMEALGRGCLDTGLVFSVGAHLFACVMPLLEGGSDGQKDRYLPRLASGEWVGANAITEPEAGSDVFALKTRAVREGEHYVLDGGKSYVTNGPDADVFLVYAVTDPTHGYMGVSAFLVEKDTPGLRVGRPFQKMGLSTSPIAPLYLESCRVPAAARLGAEGQGASVFKRSMQWERACLFGAYVGLMERVLEETVDFARQRKQFKRAIGKNQAVSHRLADMKQRLDSARLLLYRACWLMDRGQEAELEVSLAKLAISEAAVQCGLDAIQIHGGMGYVVETGIERVLRDAIPSTLFSGTSEIQRDIIANHLGL